MERSDEVVILLWNKYARSTRRFAPRCRRSPLYPSSHLLNDVENDGRAQLVNRQFIQGFVHLSQQSRRQGVVGEEQSRGGEGGVAGGEEHVQLTEVGVAGRGEGGGELDMDYVAIGAEDVDLLGLEDRSEGLLLVVALHLCELRVCGAGDGVGRSIDQCVDEVDKSDVV